MRFARAGLSAFCVRCPTSATHNDSPASAKTYDFIQIVSFRGHSQYLATCAKMTPWQRDCNMPSIRMGALTGTSVWEASEDTMAVTWRLTPAVTPLMYHFNPVLVRVFRPSDTTTSQGRNTTRHSFKTRFQVMSQNPPKDGTGYSATSRRSSFGTCITAMRTVRRMSLCGHRRDVSTDSGSR